MRSPMTILLRLFAVMALALSVVAMTGMAASAQEEDEGPTQEILEDGTIIQETGEDGPSQSVDDEGNIEQETGEDGPCQIIDDEGNIEQSTDGDCGEEPEETPTPTPTEKPEETPTPAPTEKPEETPTPTPVDDKDDDDKKEDVVVDALPSTGQGSNGQGSSSGPLMLGAMSVLLMLAAGVAWMQRRMA